MILERAEAANNQPARVPEGINHSAAAGSDRAVENKQTVAADTAKRAAGDHAAVRQGILPQAPEIIDSSSPSKSQISSTDAFSKKFDGMKPGDIRNEKDASYQFTVDKDGTQHRFSENFGSHATREEVVHPDQTTELTTSGKGVLDTKQWDANGNLRSDSYNAARTPDGKLNFTDQQNWNAAGKKLEDYKRWQDDDGQYHEDHVMNLTDGSTINQKMDGDRTVTKTTNPDGSWDNVVKTMNVDQVDPATGRHYKTMTVDRSSGK
jgi:hypothetical protein